MERMSFVFSAPAKKLLPSDPGFGTPPGILAAMQFPHALVKTVLEGYTLTVEEKKTRGGAAWKLFDSEHYEGGRAQRAIYLAHKIENVISTGIDDTITLDTSFYNKGKKKPFFTVRFSFSRIHGTMSAYRGYSEAS